MADRVKRPPANEADLRALALRYVEKYATTAHKLQRYLQRKTYERGWAGEGAVEAAILRIAGAMVEQRYVDDQAWAEMRARGLASRGFGPRRVEQDLRSAGVDRDIVSAQRPDEEAAYAAAEAFARRRRIGAFARTRSDQDGQRRALAAMLRAGHSMELARQFALASSTWDTGDENAD